MKPIIFDFTKLCSYIMWIFRLKTIFLKLVLFVTLCGCSRQQTCSFEKDKDIGLPNLTTRNNQPEGNCCDICYNTPGCKGYAWNSYDGGTCWLKGGASNLVSNAGVYVGILLYRKSANITNGGTCSITKNQDISLPNLASINDEPEGNCCNVCQTIAGCKGYAWNDYLGGTCWLKSGSGPTFMKEGVNVGILGSVIDENLYDNANVQNVQGNAVNTQRNRFTKCRSIKPADLSNYEVHCTLPSVNREPQHVNCETETIVGVKATYQCKPYFKSTGTIRISFKICLSDGQWSPNEIGFACELDCGIKNKSITKLIARGDFSSTEKWPWYAAIFRKYKGSFMFICGGSLIERNVVMTASHCVTNEQGNGLSSKLFKVVLGAVSSDLVENYDNWGAQVIKVKEIITHSNYNPENLEADIALLVLEKDVKIIDTVHPVCFPNDNQATREITQKMLRTGSQGHVAGFGYDETWKISKKLKEIKIPLVNYRECFDSLGRRHTSTQFCAGHANGTSPCQGDSGGGLYFPCNTPEMRYYIQGIVSYGGQTVDRQCDALKYTVFTRVVSFQSWVVDKLQIIHSERDERML